MDALLPATPLRAVPPSQVGGPSSVVAGRALVLGMVPLCSYVRVQRLKGVALASSLPSTERTAWSGRLSAMTRLCRPAVLLTYRALDAEPEDLLAAFQSGVVGIIPPEGIALMVPFSQKSFASRVLALCKGGLLDLLPADFVCICTLWAASLASDPVIGSCVPLVATDLTQPTKLLIAVCHHAVWCTIVCCIVQLSCNQGSLGGQGVVLAHFAAATLGATCAIAPVANSRLPAVQVAIWALITYPPHLLAAVRLDVNGAQVTIGSMVPLLLKSWIKAADIQTFLLYSLAVA